MAEVQVSNWAEFVEAIAVSGDTVILPEEAEWNMAEILPYGLQSNVSFACRKIEGNGTRILTAIHFCIAELTSSTSTT